MSEVNVHRKKGFIMTIATHPGMEQQESEQHRKEAEAAEGTAGRVSLSTILPSMLIASLTASTDFQVVQV